MYNPNQPGKTAPPPPAQNYGAATTYQGGYQPGAYANVYPQNVGYDLPGSSKEPYHYENPPNGAMAGNGLFDDYSLNEFSSVKIRHGFIRKVYLILSAQLLFTFGIALLTVFNQSVRYFVIKNSLLFLVLSIVLTFPIIITLACYPHLGKKYPTNYFLLFLVTIGLTCLVLMATAVVKVEIFLYALGTTAGVTLALTLFSFQTKYDFTGWGVYLYMGFIILMIIGIIAMFIPGKVINLVYAGIGTLLVSIAIIVDTQLIVGGKHRKYEYSIDDYIFAALTLYMDIVNLFLMLLTIFSNADN